MDSSSSSENKTSSASTHRSGGFSETDPASRFHMDMIRVLESRKEMLETSSNSSSLSDMSTMERKKRPTILSQDIDGAIRVASMLRHMVNIGVATEESFQIVLEAFCNRGRLRWKNKESNVVCAADEVGGILEELWDRQNGNISTHTCNLALRAYAACSTPRGYRQYAAKAQSLLDKMEIKGIVPSVESFSYVINAWAWQQGNLVDGQCAEMAQKNLERLREMSPDDEIILQSLDWVLEAWSKSLSEDAATHAESILHEMKQIRKRNPTCLSPLPNSQSYTNAILAWAKSRRSIAAAKAHELLFQCIKNFEEGEFPSDSEPELFAFSKCVIRCQICDYFCFCDYCSN
jgi:hypothetical protein